MTGPEAGPVAVRLVELLRATGRTRLARAAVQRAHLEADPSSVGTAGARRGLAAALDELAAAGVLVPTRETDDGVPPLPKSVKLLRPGAVGPVAAGPGGRGVPWHAELAWAADLPHPPPVLRRVSDWLFAGGTRAVEVPLRERALEITGDETAFDDGLPGRLDLATLRARRVVPPLHVESLPAGGTVLLVVENADTADSLVRALRDDPGPVAGVAWGAGNAFTASVLRLRDDPPAAIRYFGDLDAAGLRIPRRASELAVAEGLPEVRPATGLYRALLEHGVPAPSARIDHSDVDWLDPGLRGPVRELFASGMRLAQEAVGHRVLSAGRDWRTGLPPT